MTTPHAKTRSSSRHHRQTRSHPQPHPPSPPLEPASTQPHQPSTTQAHNQDESVSDNKRRRLHKGKGKIENEDVETEAVPKVELRDGIQRTLFKEPSVEATERGINRARLTTDERALVQRVLPYSIHGGRYYPHSWLLQYPTLSFFMEFLGFQEWSEISQYSGPVYPIEVVQFFATVTLSNQELKATVNGVDITITTTDFCSTFTTPNDGLVIDPSVEWANVSDDQKMVIKTYFDLDASENSVISASSLSPKLKFFLNFLWNTVIPRRGGRDKLSSYEAVVLHSWLEGMRVNLPCLVFHRIVQISAIVTKEKHCTTIDLPYGMWISRLLEVKKVVNPESYGVESRNVMCDKFLKIMGFGVDDVPATCTPPVPKTEQGTSALEAKLDVFLDAVMGQLHNHSTILADVVSGIGKGSTKEGGSDGSLPSWVNGIEHRLDDMEKRLKDVYREVLAQGDKLKFLSSQGGALVKDGKAIKEDVDQTLEATKALSLKILNFERSITAQAEHVRSCFDRLTTLEYRTRPGYVHPAHAPNP